MEVLRKPPLNLTSEDVDRFERHARAQISKPELFRFGPGYYLTASQTAYNDKGQLQRPTISFSAEAPIFSRRFFWTRWFVQRRVHSQRPLVLITDKYADNYYHWHAEVLPSLLHFMARPEAAAGDWQLLIPYSCARLGFVRESLEVLAPGRYLLAKYGENFSADEFYFCRKGLPIGNPDPELMCQLVQRLQSPLQSSVEPHRRIYVRRSGIAAEKRSLLNEQDVSVLLSKLGFECLDFDYLSYQEQILVASQSKTLISIHGAGLTNMMFMQQNSAVYELLSRPDIMNLSNCFYALANCFGHRYYYQACASNQDNNLLASIGNPKGHFTVDLAALERDITQFEL